MSTMLAQLLEILQAHGLMERSDERFLSAQDLVQLDGYLAAYAGDDTGQRSPEHTDTTYPRRQAHGHPRP